jgi:benzoyl-CoA 2,3-dioxygenase component B
VEQQRVLGNTAPSIYDLRNLFQVNVEEGRHLWAMVYLLQTHFGADGRDEAEAMLERHSGDQDNPRILQAFNYPVNNWLDFFCFTAFMDRDGKYQLASLAESSFDPLARTTQFMLAEEAYHLQTGENGVGRIVKRTGELMAAGQDPRKVGAIPLDVIQRYVNFWAASSIDLFGAEVSSNSANFFRSGLKGRAYEEKQPDHKALEGIYKFENFANGRLSSEEVPLRNAMNEVLRDEYVKDNERGVAYWNRVCERFDNPFRFRLPHRRFHRTIGAYAGHHFDIDGNPIDEATWNARVAEWLPTEADRTYVKSLMVPCFEKGKYASWIAAPAKGVDDKAADFEYVVL